MTTQQLIDKIKACANGYRHPDYQRTKDLATLYRQIVTMEQQGKLVISYKPSESEFQKEQRVEIYKSKTPSVVSQIMSQFDYVRGAARMTDAISYMGEMNVTKEQWKAALDMAVSRFYGKQSLQQYLEEKQRHYAFIDPNAWLTIDPEGNPSTASAESAVDFAVKGGLTEYLIVNYTVFVPQYQYTDVIYYAYQAGETVYAISENPKKTSADYPQTGYISNTTIDGVSYRFYSFPNTSAETPAIRFGYLPDDATEGRTFVGVLDKVTEEFKDLISQKSEYDLSLNLHTFLKKYQFVDNCDYKDANSPHIRCNNGTLHPTGGTCPKCKGSGVKSHTSSQDVINVKKPGEEDKEIKLADMVYYAAMPFDIVEHQAARVDKIAKEIPKYIFGVDIESRPSGMATATEIANYYDSMYVTLASFADKISENYIFAVTAIAQMRGIGEQLVVSHRYPRSFKMESLADLFAMLKSAKDSGASAQIIWGIEQQILAMQNKDNPAALELEQLKQRYKPFKELTEQERIIEVSQLSVGNRYRVLHGYSDLIFRLVMQRFPAFFLFPEVRQDEIVFAIADEIAKEFEDDMPSLETTNDNGQESDSTSREGSDGAID